MPFRCQFDWIRDEDKRRIREAPRAFSELSIHFPWTDTPCLSPIEAAAEFGVRQIDIPLEASLFLAAAWQTYISGGQNTDL